MGIIIWIAVIVLIIYGVGELLDKDGNIFLKIGCLGVIIEIAILVLIVSTYVFFGKDLDYWVNIIEWYLGIMIITWVIGGIMYAVRK